MHKTIITAFLFSAIALPLMSSDYSRTVEKKVEGFHNISQEQLEQIKNAFSTFSIEASNKIDTFIKKSGFEQSKDSESLDSNNSGFKFVFSTHLKIEKTTQKDN